MNLRYAVRMLVKAPGFTLIAVLTLALGIGLNTVVFTLYESVAWKPLAVRAPEQIVRVAGRYDEHPIEALSFPEYEQLRSDNRSFSAVIATSAPQTVLCTLPDAKPGEAAVLRARLVSANYFEALGVTPVLGRPFGTDKDPAAVVSHALWKRKLGADQSVLGKVLTVQGAHFTIVGVAPAAFAGTGLPPQMPDLWIPLSMQPVILPGLDWLHETGAREFQILARLKPPVTIEQASAELDMAGRAMPPVDGKPVQLRVKKATFFQTDSGEFEVFGVISMILLAAVTLILLIGCVNLVNLMLARNAEREHEIAVRLALGASRTQLVRQLCTESLLLGLLGGACGLLLSLWSCEWIRLWLTQTLDRVSGGAWSLLLDIRPDWRVLAYTVVLSVVTGVAVGVWPAIRAAQSDVNSALKQGITGAGRGARSFWSKRNLLLTAQVAGCLMLLAGTGLLFRGVWRSQTIDPGFDMKHIFVMGVNTRAVAQKPHSREGLLRKVIDRLLTVPEVTSVAWADRPPFIGHGSGDFQNDRGSPLQCLFNPVSDRYFETLGIPILAGRDFTTLEIERRDPVVIISESAARQAWPGEDPIGRRISGPAWVKGELGHNSFTVIGVVKSVRSTYLSKVDQAFLYFPRPLSNSFGLMLVRTRIKPETTFRSVLTALGGVNANLPSQTFMISLEQGPVEIQKLMAETPAVVASVLGLLALILASVGVYGLVSQLVAQRTKEIGIRIALGAQDRDVIRMVLLQTLRPVVWGAGIGLIGAFCVSGLLAALIVLPDAPDLTYGAGAFYPAAFLGALAVLIAVVLIAGFLPARRATHVEPAVALRNE